MRKKPPILEPSPDLKLLEKTKAARVVKPRVVTRASKQPAKQDAIPVVVGIGASAGGLEAFSRLLAALPADTGMAFVLVQHLDPNHDSVLRELLSRTTSLPVLEIKDGTSAKANNVYVIPPNTNLAIGNGVLRLSSRTAGRGQHRPIDDFLSSLALDRGHRAIGVILSGTASDGTLGLEAVKGEGGITFAQDEASAKFDSMPHSAVAAGVVDFVLPPEGIAAELVRLSHKSYLLETGAELGAELGTVEAALKSKKASSVKPEAAKPEDDGFKRILQLMHRARGVDFSLYRSTTVRRRIDRRMLLDNIASLAIYAKRLSTHSEELEVLYQDLLIGVTRFFRDPQAFEFLQHKVFPNLIKYRAANQDLRIWVSGCSTGQEAYSLAMAYLEFTGKEKIHVPLRVFATDLNQANLEKARAGYYPKSLMHDVSKERLKRFFTEEKGSYRISKAVRELVVFAHHNVFSDPPFSRMDLISCRNLLIYLEPVLQTRVIPTFHYALKPEGVLFLGASETVGRHTDLFAPLDNKCRVYTKLPASSRIPKPMLPLAAATASKNQPEQANLVSPPQPDVQSEADRILLARYAPAGVLVNEQLEIVQFRGVTGHFLEMPSGKASFQLLRMAREGLMLPLRSLLERVKKENRALRTEDVRFVHEGATETVNLEVVPLRQPGCLLVLFETPSATVAVAKTPTKSRTAKNRNQAHEELQEMTQQMSDLKRELLETREYLQFVQEQGEAINEELQSTNEEAQSANEEMQSLNEELETAKEELESSNEEMRTINDELNERNTDLRLLNEDHLNFQASVELGIVTVGADLTVRRFTPQAEKALGLRVADIGQPIWHVRHSLEKINLQALIMTVIASDNPSDLEVQDLNGCWFLLRIRPYRTLENQTDGAVLVLFGIDALKHAELERERLQHETELIFESLKEGLIALDRDWIVTYVNAAGARLSQLTRETMLGLNIWELFPEAKNSVFETNYRKALEEHITVEFEAYSAALKTQFEICVVPVQAGITIFFRDVTERHNTELVVAQTQEKLRVLADGQRRFLADAAHELRAPLAVIQGNLEVLERFPNMTVIERKDAINESARESIRLGRLANDLLALARGDAGDGLQLERLELVPILEQTLREAEHLASGRSLEHLILEPCTILGDADKLKQLTLILLDNALKYAPEGGRVWLELKHLDSHAEIRISNTGQGISKDDLKRVFERFYRTDTSRSRQTGGTGLGLSIARWIGEQHGGTVELESELGATTTAIVRLPLV